MSERTLAVANSLHTEKRNQRELDHASVYDHLLSYHGDSTFRTRMLDHGKTSRGA